MSLSHNADDTAFVIIVLKQPHNHGEAPLLPTLSNRVYSAVVIFLTGFQLRLFFRGTSVDPSQSSQKWLTGLIFVSLSYRFLNFFVLFVWFQYFNLYFNR